MDEIITWEYVYSRWKYECESLYKPILENVGFKEYYIECSEDELPYGWIREKEICVIDWLPADYGDDTEAILRKVTGSIWRTGYIETAKMLWKNKNNPEAIALIWILACLRDETTNNYIRCSDYSMQLQIENVVIDRMSELGIGWWSGRTKYTLPTALLEGMHCEINIQYFFQLMKIIVLQFIFIRTTYQLSYVTIKNKDRKEDSDI